MLRWWVVSAAATSTGAAEDEFDLAESTDRQTSRQTHTRERTKERKVLVGAPKHNLIECNGIVFIVSKYITKCICRSKLLVSEMGSGVSAPCTPHPETHTHPSASTALSTYLLLQ